MTDTKRIDFLLIKSKKQFWQKRNWGKFQLKGALGRVENLTEIEAAKFKIVKSIIADILKNWEKENERLRKEIESDGKSTCEN